MDELSGKVQNASTHILSRKVHKHTRTATSQFKGAMDELSRKVQNASTHILSRKIDEHAHNNQSVQGGDGGNFAEGSKSEHTYVASFWYTLVWVSVAFPKM